MDINLKNEINFLKKSTGILAIIIILLFMVGYLGLKNIFSLKAKVDANKIIKTTLEQKISILEFIIQIIPNDVTFLDIVLPSRGSVLYGISQVKNQASTFNLSISGVKSGNIIAEENGVFKNSLTFEIIGEEQKIYQFLDSFSKLLPLMVVDKVSFSKASDFIRSEVTINVYSASLPQKITALTEPINELTVEEITLLNEVLTYGMPQFVEPKVSDTIEPKIDPFN